ncbi:chemotaxis protein CheW [Salinisphaera sp. SWV1]|uniref:chemotaxis protein CheW n=1 Tax=Salinisphaera sp. SWV1 TaxID=3454139 RepID=UPI003F85F1FF
MSALSLATLVLAGTEVALESDALQEVVPLPERLAPVPQAPAWSLGSFVLRGAPVPVIDFAQLLGLGGDQAPARRLVAIVAREGQVFGFAVDGVGQVLGVAAADCHSVTRSHGGLVPRMFARDGGEAVYVLDLDAVFALENLLQVQQGAAAGSGEPATARAAGGEVRALALGCGELRVALALSVVHEITRRGTVIEPAIGAHAYVGHVDWRGRRLALLDPAALVGRPRSVGSEGLVVVVELGCGWLALAADEALGIVACDETRRRTATDSDRIHNHVAALLEDEALGPLLLLDHAQLAANDAVAAYAALAQGTAVRAKAVNGADAAGAGEAWTRFAYMHFTAAGKLSAAVEDIDAVTAYPSDTMPCPVGGPFQARFVHGGRTVMLADLRALLWRGTPTTAEAGRVLIVTADDGAVGFVVDSVEAIAYIEAPAASYHEHRAGPRSDGDGLVGCKRLVRVGVGAQQQFLSVVRLRDLAAMLLAEPSRVQAAG